MTKKKNNFNDIVLVPNQRAVKVVKEPTDKKHLYTMNNLAAIDEAARLLQSKGGFKLYIYIAKNQNEYCFALSSSDFMLWSGLGIKAYNTAFQELVDKGYLISMNESNSYYTFYDKSQIEQKKEDTVLIRMAASK